MSDTVDRVAVAIGMTEPGWDVGLKWKMNGRNRQRLQAAARAAIKAMERVNLPPSEESYDRRPVKVGDVIECRQVRQFDGDLYHPMIVCRVNRDSFCAELLFGDFGEPSLTMMVFEMRARGETWR
jgi:hypothetical protein